MLLPRLLFFGRSHHAVIRVYDEAGKVTYPVGVGLDLTFINFGIAFSS